MLGVNAFATSEIQITIGDVNDNKPEFYDCTEACVIQNTFSGNIDEHSAVGLSVLGLSMGVMDGDKVRILFYSKFSFLSEFCFILNSAGVAAATSATKKPQNSNKPLMVPIVFLYYFIMNTEVC